MQAAEKSLRFTPKVEAADLMGVADEEPDVTDRRPDATLQSDHAAVQVRVGDQSDGGEAPAWPEAEVSHQRFSAALLFSFFKKYLKLFKEASKISKIYQFVVKVF